jgi:hypothetical protein
MRSAIIRSDPEILGGTPAEFVDERISSAPLEPDAIVVRRSRSLGGRIHDLGRHHRGS